MVDVGVAALTQQRVAAAYAKKNLQEAVDYFWHGVVIMCLVGVFFTCLILLLSGQVPKWVGVDHQYEEVIIGCFLLSASATLLSLFNFVLKAFASGLQRNAIHSIGGVIGGCAGVTIIFICLTQLRLGLWSLAIGHFSRQIIEALINAVYCGWLLCLTKNKTRWSRNVFRDYRCASLATFSNKAAGSLAKSLPRIALARIIGPEATVVYSLTLRPVELASAFISRSIGAFSSSFNHYAADVTVSEDRKVRLAEKTSWSFIGINAVVLTAYCFFNEAFIGIWAGPEYYAGSMFTVLAALAFYHEWKNNLLSALLIGLGQVAKANFIQAGAKLLLSALVIPSVYWMKLEGIPAAIIIISTLSQFVIYHQLTKVNEDNSKPMHKLLWVWALGAVVLFVASRFGGSLPEHISGLMELFA